MKALLARSGLAWAALAPRERVWLSVGLSLLGLLAGWYLALAPALQTLRDAPARQHLLDGQLDRMRALAAQSEALQRLPALKPAERLSLLKQGLAQTLGEQARMSVNGNRASITFKDVPPSALAQWLVQTRSEARAFVEQAELEKNAAGQWSGSLTLTWPGP